MVKLTIDKKEIEVEEGTTILEAAASGGVTIPKLCHHESLTPIGSCRICVVEIQRQDGKTGIVTACNYPVDEGMSVATNSPKAIESRKLMVELLLARAPYSESIQELANELGISQSRFRLEVDNCVLCQRCLRTCKELVGVNAISFINPNADQEVENVLIDVSAEKCIGCGSCAYACPTEAIAMDDNQDTRTLHLPSGTIKFKLQKCQVCGNYWAPEKQLEYIARITQQSPDIFNSCPQCRD